MTAAQPETDALLRPIAGDNPAGRDVRYERLYLDIREARRSDDTASPGVWYFDPKLPDWAATARLATDALEHTSKDLQLAAWYTEARMHLDGYHGVADGLRITLALMRKFWDALYPEIDDLDSGLRVGILRWLDKVLAAGLPELPVTDEQHPLIEAALATAGEIEEFVRREAWEEDVLRGTRNALQRALERPPSAATEPPETDLPAVETSPPKPPPSRESTPAQAEVAVPPAPTRSYGQTARERFLGQLEVAERCVRENRFTLAVSLFEALAAEVDHFHLELWEEPQLAARVWAGLWRAHANAEPGTRAAERRAVALDRLCRMDPEAAYELGA